MYIHVEAPDESGHRHELDNKIKSIEKIDEMLGKMIPQLKAWGEDYAIMLLPDHPTPIPLMTHIGDPVPFVLYRSDVEDMSKGTQTYCEEEAAKTGLFIDPGCELMKKFIEKNF